MSKERDIGRVVRAGVAVGLGLVDSFLLSQPRNAETIFREKGISEGIKNASTLLMVPITTATVTFAISRRMDFAVGAAAGAYLFEGLLCDFNEFLNAMEDPESVKRRWLNRLQDKIYLDDNF